MTSSDSSASSFGIHQLAAGINQARAVTKMTGRVCCAVTARSSSPAPRVVV